MQCARCGMRVDSGEVCPRCGHNLNYGYRHPDADLICRKKKRKIRWIIALLAAVFLLWNAVTIGNVLFGGSRKSERLYQSQQQMLQQLEEVYQTGDYPALGRLLDQLEPDGAVFEKYEYMYGLYDRLEQGRRSVERYIQDRKNNDPNAYLSPYDLMELFRVAQRTEEIRENDYLLAEEDRVEQLHQQAEALMQEQLGLTQEQISRGVEMARDDDLDFDDYCDQLIKQIGKGNGDEM